MSEHSTRYKFDYFSGPSAQILDDLLCSMAAELCIETSQLDIYTYIYKYIDIERVSRQTDTCRQWEANVQREDSYMTITTIALMQIIQIGKQTLYIWPTNNQVIDQSTYY